MTYITGMAGSGFGRYFTDSGSSPRLWWADENWGILGNAGRWSASGGGATWQLDISNYVSARAAQGFNVIYTHPFASCTGDSANPIGAYGAYWDGTQPFGGTNGNDPSSGFTTAFWNRVDYLISEAASYGVTVALNLDMCYDEDPGRATNPVSVGWTQAQWTAYGTGVATRYASSPNIIYTMGDDYWADQDSTGYLYLYDAVTAVDSTRTWTMEYKTESITTEDLDGNAEVLGRAIADFHFCYTYNCTYFAIEAAYADTSYPFPAIYGDGQFLGEGVAYSGVTQYPASDTEDRTERMQCWWALSSGARGCTSGSHAVWLWDDMTGTVAPLCVTSDPYGTWFSATAGTIRAFFEGLPGFHQLIPDTSSALVTSGRGTRVTTLSPSGNGIRLSAFPPTNNYVSASKTPSGNLAVIYIPQGGTIGIDQTKMPAGYTATWVDPVTCATTAGTAGSSYTTPGSNSAGNPDWVLVLATPSSSNSGPNYASAQGTGTGSGSWVNPAYAEGAPNAQFATWAVP